MKNKFVVIIIFLIFTAGLTLSIHYINKQETVKVNVSEVNDIVKTAEKEWKSKSFYLPKTKLKFKIIDLHGNIVSSNFKCSADDYDMQIIGAVKNNDTILDIISENQLAGKVIILNESKSLDILKRRLEIIVILVFSILLVICIIYFLYLNIYIYKPFKKLQKFAGKVAEGNLDIPLEMDKHNVFGAFTESFDIMREQLKLSRQNEYLANQSKKELVASLSHDIKTPVASIKAICEILQLKISNKDESLKIHTIYKKSEQIEKLINDMFQSTLHELKELKVEPQIYESTIVHKFIKDADFYGKLKIMNDCPECLIFVDKLRIEQVIDNIINNSYKYANTDIEIHYELSKTHLIVYFKDFGSGVPEEELELIFNKFYRGTNSKGITGSGLGLFLSEYFMEHMQGEVECYNENGFVSKIYIKLA